MVAVSPPGGEFVRGLARDEALTRGLGDEEARMLVEWLVAWAELLIETARDPCDAQELVARLSRRGRAIGRFVQLWCDRGRAAGRPSWRPWSGSRGRCPAAASSRRT